MFHKNAKPLQTINQLVYIIYFSSVICQFEEDRYVNNESIKILIAVKKES
jgi:hypothetical protein